MNSPEGSDGTDETVEHLIALDRDHDASAPWLQRVADRVTRGDLSCSMMETGAVLRWRCTGSSIGVERIYNGGNPRVSRGNHNAGARAEVGKAYIKVNT